MLNIGEVEKVTAISHFRVTASWDGSRAKTEQDDSIYTPPPGFVIKQIEVIVHSSNNGSISVDVIGGGLELITEEILDSAYDEAFEIALRNNDKELEGKLKDKKEYHSRELQKYSSNMNVLKAHIKASAHGSTIDRKRGWQEISVIAEIMYLGTNDKNEIFNALKQELGI